MIMANRFNKAPDRFVVKAVKLAWACIWHPTYDVLLCARTVIPPSPWTECFEIEVDHKHRVIRLTGDFD